MELPVNIRVPPVGGNLKDDVQDAVVGRLDVSVLTSSLLGVGGV